MAALLHAHSVKAIDRDHGLRQATGGAELMDHLTDRSDGASPSWCATISLTDHSVQSVGWLQSVTSNRRTRSSIRSHSLSASRIASACPIGGISRTLITASRRCSAIVIIPSPSLALVEVVEEHLHCSVAEPDPSIASRFVGRLLADQAPDDREQHVRAGRIHTARIGESLAPPLQ